MNKENAIQILERRLEYLQRQEAITADPALRFQLREQIQETNDRIKELKTGGKIGPEPGPDPIQNAGFVVHMKDFFERLAAAIPAYFEDLLLLVSGPKRFVAGRITKLHQPVKESLIFLGVSHILIFALELPLARGNPWPHLGADSVLTLLKVCAYTGVMHAAWRLVGGAATFRKIFPIYVYYAGVGRILLGATFLAVMGAMKAADPGLFKELSDAQYQGNFLAVFFENLDRAHASSGFWIAILIEFVGICGMLAWLVAGWGAYRLLNGVSRPRSLAAASLFILFSIPLEAVMFIIANVLSSAS